MLHGAGAYAFATFNFEQKTILSSSFLTLLLFSHF
jgi:hypothetical protein